MRHRIKTLKSGIKRLIPKEHTPLNQSYVERNKLYNSTRWKSERRKHLDNNPWCVKCGKKANTVDHSKMHHIGIDEFGNTWLDYFWMSEFYRSYCQSCHSRKTTQEDQQNKPQRMTAAARAKILADVKSKNQ